MKQSTTLFWTSTAFLSLLFGIFAQASGGMEGGGGKTVVCRNPDGSIRSAEILDLYEGRTVYQLSYLESSKDWKTQGLDILTKANVPTAEISGWYVNAINYLTFLPEGTSLKPIDDSLEAIIPDGCALEQTVYYQNDRRILVSGTIWNALSETQKAALIIHESIYRYLRGYGETDSRRARHLTAHIASGNTVEPINPSGHYELLCNGGSASSNTYFYVVKLPQDSADATPQIRIQFGMLGGRIILSKTYFDLVLEIRMDTDPKINLIDELRNPTHHMGFREIKLQSLFEPGDVIELRFQDQDGKGFTEIRGTSIVDGSRIGPINITCQ